MGDNKSRKRFRVDNFNKLGRCKFYTYYIIINAVYCKQLTHINNSKTNIGNKYFTFINFSTILIKEALTNFVKKAFPPLLPPLK